MADAPVGRRIVVGLLGLGVLGVAFGARAANGIAELMAPIEERDPTGLTGLIPAAGGFRYYSISGGGPPRPAPGYPGDLRRPGGKGRASHYTHLAGVSAHRVGPG